MKPTLLRRTAIVVAALLLALTFGWTVAGAAETAAGDGTRPQRQMSPERREKVRAAMQACRADASSLCSGVERGGGRILACLKQHESELSSGCSAALAEAPHRRAR